MATKRKRPTKPAAAAPTDADRAAIAPLFLVPPLEGATRWSLCLADGDSPVEVFEAEGHSGNGYAWDSVARVVLTKQGARAARAIEFDSEAGTFVAQGTGVDELLALGRSLVELVRDAEALRRAIRAVPEDDWDD